MKSMVTTGYGDSGQTHTLDGETVFKDDPVIEALGALDTMRTQIALLRTQLQEHRPETREETEFLLFVLQTCFLIGSAVGDPRNRKPEWHPIQLNASHLKKLETEQARLEASLCLPRAFIVCAANIQAAQADVVASAVRSFERRLVALRREYPEAPDSLYTAFVNRLSDYFFILARYLEQGRHHAMEYSSITLDAPVHDSQP